MIAGMDAAEMGRRGGRSRSAAKRAAARRNGARGGRPRDVDVLARCADEIGGSVPMPVSELSKVEWIEGRLAVPVEIHYDRISGGLTFSSVRSRAQIVAVGDEKLRVAALVDVIRSKQAAGRPKDRAVLPILRDTLAVKKRLGDARFRSVPGLLPGGVKG